VVVIVKDGRVLLEKGCGYADYGRSISALAFHLIFFRQGF
jgi:hypothetical protein